LTFSCCVHNDFMAVGFNAYSLDLYYLITKL
jgi:hypothetical protein